MKHTKQSIISKDGVSYLIPFILITSCFALWGFANDITNPMVKAFSKIFRMSATDGLCRTGRSHSNGEYPDSGNGERRNIQPPGNQRSSKPQCYTTSILP